MADPAGLMTELPEGVAAAHWYEDGVLRLIYAGVKSSIFPCLIFLCIGAMTDLRARCLQIPISLLLGAAAQLGIYVAFIIALLLRLHPAGGSGYLDNRWRGRPHRYLQRNAACGSPACPHCSCGVFVYGSYPAYSSRPS